MCSYTHARHVSVYIVEGIEVEDVGAAGGGMVVAGKVEGAQRVFVARQRGE